MLSVDVPAKNHALNRDDLLVALLAAFVFLVQSLAWPLAAGRDCYSYFYYVYDFGSKTPADWFTLMFRTPLAPLFDVFLIDGLGPRLAEILMGAIYVGVMLLLFRTALVWGRRIAWVFVGALLAHFAYGSLFHVVSNDPPVAIVFALLLSSAFYAVKKANWKAFALLGTVAGLTQMARPGIFGWVGLVAFVVGGIAWRRRAILFLVFGLALSPWVLGWSYYNYRTYGSFQFSIGTEVFIPLGRSLAIDQTVAVENGPASAELGRLLEQTVLKEKKYEGWDANRYLKHEAQYIALMGWLDRTLGRGHYRLLSAVGWEAVRAHPWTYGVGVLKTFAHMMTGSLKLPVPLRNQAFIFTHKGAVAYQKNGQDTMTPLSEVDPFSLSRDPVTDRKFEEKGPAMLQAYQTSLRLPPRDGSIFIGRALNAMTYVYPPMLLLIISAFGLLYVKRRLFSSSLVRALFVVWSLAVLTDFAACLGMWTAIYQYRLPFDVVYLLFPIVLVFHPRPSESADLQRMEPCATT